jgi:hypothetical protein
VELRNHSRRAVNASYRYLGLARHRLGRSPPRLIACSRQFGNLQESMQRSVGSHFATYGRVINSLPLGREQAANRAALVAGYRSSMTVMALGSE